MSQHSARKMSVVQGFALSQLSEWEIKFIYTSLNWADSNEGN